MTGRSTTFDNYSLSTRTWAEFGREPDLAKLEEEFASKPGPSSEVAIPEPNLDAYDRLLPSACEARP